MTMAVDKLSPHDILRKIEKELLALKEQHPEKLLVMQDIVDAAADPQNVMHGEFTWDDTEAAKEHRLMQARMLVRKVKITNPSDLNKPPIPMFVSLMEDRAREGGGYRQTAEVLSNDELLNQLEATAKNELAAWTKRHAMLTDLVSAVSEAAGIEPPVAQPKTRRQRRAS